MKPLVILTVVFILLILVKRIFRVVKLNLSLIGRIALSCMLVFTGISHFIFMEGMILMLPSFLPLKKETVLFTGLLEILAAIGLLIPSLVKLTSQCLIIFFILILPANVLASIHQIDIQTATYTGPGPSYLYFRIPLQLFFIGWTYYFCIKLFTKNKNTYLTSKSQTSLL